MPPNICSSGVVERLPSEPAADLPWGPRLTGAQRMELARLTGAAERWALGDLRDRPDDEALQVLLGYSADPLLWGVLLGSALRHVEVGDGAYVRLAVVARRAGADEDAAAAHLAWMRQQPGM
jgi:hypothetical protein